MSGQLPLWSFSKWWVEFPRESAEYRQRYVDFKRMVRGSGVPVVRMDETGVVGVDFATQKDCDKVVNFGSHEVPDEQVVCRWCGQKKTQYTQFLEELRQAQEEKRTPKKIDIQTQFRTIDPYFTQGWVDCEHGQNWIWAKCPHIYAWTLAPARTKGIRFRSFLLLGL